MKALLFLLWLPLAAFGSTVYTFSERIPQGTVGFTYTAHNYLGESSSWISPWYFTACDNSGVPGWICTGATLQQGYVNGLPDVQVWLTVAYLAAAGDAFSTDEVHESFPGGTLMSDGTWSAFLNDATFTVHDPLDAPAAVPEPSSWELLILGGVPGLLALCIAVPEPEDDYRFPRRACSRSIASNKALKFPLPKLRLPLR